MLRHYLAEPSRSSRVTWQPVEAGLISLCYKHSCPHFFSTPSRSYYITYSKEETCRSELHIVLCRSKMITWPMAITIHSRIRHAVGVAPVPEV